VGAGDQARQHGDHGDADEAARPTWRGDCAEALRRRLVVHHRRDRPGEPLLEVGELTGLLEVLEEVVDGQPRRRR